MIKNHLKLYGNIYIKLGAIVFLGVMIFMIYNHLVSEGKRCTDNPFMYGAGIVEEKSNKELVCNCYLGNVITPSFYFNDEIVKSYIKTMEQKMEETIFAWNLTQ